MLYILRFHSSRVSKYVFINFENISDDSAEYISLIKKIKHRMLRISKSTFNFLTIYEIEIS